MPRPSEKDPLRPMLREAESDLARKLEEACAMHDVQEETTGELMRLEETLLEAARAAKQAVSVRRRLRTLGGVGGDDEADERGVDATEEGDEGEHRSDAGPQLVGQPQQQQQGSSVRDFVDENRVEWRVWEVIPGQSRASSRADQHQHNQLGEYQAGWLAFEAVSTGQRRRLRDYPHNWNGLSNDDLEALLARAEVVRTARRLLIDNDRTDGPRQ